MNNISYKNVILGLNKNLTLPYKESGHVKYTSNTSLTDGTLNNTFNQFIDNDKFIERKLNSVTSYQYGPKSDDQEKIYYAADGYKYYKDENGQLAIYRKVENDLNSDIRKKIDGNVNFIFQYGSYYVCGTDYQLKYSTDLESWTSMILRDVKGYYSSDSMTIVAARDGIYRITANEGVIALDKINKSELAGCRCVGITDNNEIYVGCSDGVYRSRISGYDRDRKLEFEKVEIRRQYSDHTEKRHVQVNDVAQISDDIYLAAQDCVYKDREQVTLKGYERWLDGNNVNATVRIGPYTFVGTDTNLYAKHDESDQYYGLFQHNTACYSIAVINNTGYFGTLSGLIQLDLWNSQLRQYILDPIDEYPVNTKLTNVSVLRVLRDGKKNRIFGINGTTSFELGDDVGQVYNILTGVTQTDIRRMTGDNNIYISTSSGLYSLQISSYVETLETIDDFTVFNEDCSKGVVTTGNRTFMYGEHVIVDVNNSGWKYNITASISKVCYVNSFGDHDRSLLVFTTDGVGIIDLDTDEYSVTEITDDILDVGRYGNYYFAVVNDGTKYCIREYDSGFKLLKQFDLKEDKTAEIFIDGEYAYIFHRQVGYFYRYHIADFGAYKSIDLDYTNVRGIFDNGNDALMIASADGIKYSSVESDDIDEGGNTLVMSDLKSVLDTKINHIDYYGITPDLEHQEYVIDTDDGVRRIDFEYDGGKCDYSKFETEQLYVGKEVYSEANLGEKYRMLKTGTKEFVLQTNTYQQLSVSTVSNSIYSKDSTNLFCYSDWMLLSRSGNKIFRSVMNSKGEMGSATQLTCFTQGLTSTIRKIVEMDKGFVVFTINGVKNLVGPTRETVQSLTDICELTGIIENSIIKVSFGDDTITPTDGQILFAVGNEVYTLYYNNDGTSTIHYKKLLNGMSGTGDIVGIDFIMFVNESGDRDIYVWVFFKDRAIEYKWSGYTSAPSATGKVKLFKTYKIKKGFVSQKTNMNTQFVLYTTDNEVITTPLDQDEFTYVMQTASDIIRNDVTYFGQCYFFIFATDNTLYLCDKDGVLTKIKEYSYVQKIQAIPRTDEGINQYAELDSSKTISIVEYKLDKDYVVNVKQEIGDIVEYDSGILLVADGKLCYSNETDYQKFGSDSIVPFSTTASFTNSGIQHVCIDDSRVIVTASDRQYTLEISDWEITGCEILKFSDIATGFVARDIVVYNNKVTFKQKLFDLLGQLHKITRQDNLLYCGDSVFYYLGEKSSIKNLVYDSAYSLKINSIRNCGDFIAASDESGLYRFSNGKMGEQLESRGTKISGDIRDFVYTEQECFFKKTSYWYKMLSDKKTHKLVSTKNIVGFFRTKNGKDVVVREDGAYQIVYGSKTHVGVVDKKKHLIGKNVRRMFGTSGNPKLIVADSDGYQVRTFYRDSADMSEPINYDIQLKDEDGNVTRTTVNTFSYITFSDDMNVAMTRVDEGSYIRFAGGSFELIPMDIADVNSIYRNGQYFLSTKDSLIQFDSYGNLHYFYNPVVAKNDISYTKFIENGGKVYICGQYGIYMLVNDLPTRISQSKYNSEVCSFWVDGDSGTYLIPIKNFVYETNNIRLFKNKKFDIDDVTLIKQVFKRNSKDYLFVTDKGLYKTNYSYSVVNDIQKFTVQDAIEVYQSMAGQIDYYYTSWYNTHTSQYHKQGSAVDLLNNDYIDVSFEDIDESWQTHEMCSDYIATQNDIVFEIESSTNEDGDIQASSSNANQTLSGLALDDIPLTYILKRWKSGMCELYVYLTTTNTYYLAFNEGVPNCMVEPTEPIYRRNLAQVGTVATEDKTQTSEIGNHYTNVQLNIMSSFCFMDCIQDIQINGNSLPLKVYKDIDNNVDDTSTNLYQSFIEPSVVDSCDISTTDSEGYYNFHFKCFGSDAQAIRIQFYDSKHRYGGSSYIVAFDSNGGSGTMKNQRFAIGQELKLRKNTFTKKVSGQSRVFLGWSLTKQNDNTQPMFQDGAQFSEAIAGITVQSGETITLYAVWLAYNFGDGNSTQIVIESNKKQFIIKEAETFRDDKIGDSVIIDFGD